MTLPFEFVGGAPALDFVNTISWGDRDEERFNTFDDVVDWAMKAGVIKRRERGGTRELREMIKLRELLHRVFIARASGRKHRRMICACSTRVWVKLFFRFIGARAPSPARAGEAPAPHYAFARRSSGTRRNY